MFCLDLFPHLFISKAFTVVCSSDVFKSEPSNSLTDTKTELSVNFICEVGANSNSTELKLPVTKKVLVTHHGAFYLLTGRQ